MLTHITHHKVPDGSVEDSAVIILLLAELDEVFTGSWCLQNSPDTSVRHVSQWESHKCHSSADYARGGSAAQPGHSEGGPMTLNNRTLAATKPQSYEVLEQSGRGSPSPCVPRVSPVPSLRPRELMYGQQGPPHGPQGRKWRHDAQKTEFSTMSTSEVQFMFRTPETTPSRARRRPPHPPCRSAAPG